MQRQITVTIGALPLSRDTYSLKGNAAVLSNNPEGVFSQNE